MFSSIILNNLINTTENNKRGHTHSLNNTKVHILGLFVSSAASIPHILLYNAVSARKINNKPTTS